jgi:hypothetical protein
MSVETFVEPSEVEEKESSPERLHEKTAKIFEGRTRSVLKKGTKFVANAFVYGCDMQALFDKSGEVSDLTKARNLASSAASAIAWGLLLANQSEGATIASITSRGIMAPELIAMVKGAGPQLTAIMQGSFEYFKEDFQPLEDSFRHMADILKRNPALITLNLNEQQSG